MSNLCMNNLYSQPLQCPEQAKREQKNLYTSESFPLLGRHMKGKCIMSFDSNVSVKNALVVYACDVRTHVYVYAEKVSEVLFKKDI